MWNQPPPLADKNGIATAAMVVGIVSLVGTFMCGLGVIGGPVAVVLGAVGLSRANKLPGRPARGQAIAGIATGAIAVVITALLFVFLFVIGATTDADSEGWCDYDRPAQDPDC